MCCLPQLLAAIMRGAPARPGFQLCTVLLRVAIGLGIVLLGLWQGRALELCVRDPYLRQQEAGCLAWAARRRASPAISCRVPITCKGVGILEQCRGLPSLPDRPAGHAQELQPQGAYLDMLGAVQQALVQRPGAPALPLGDLGVNVRLRPQASLSLVRGRECCWTASRGGCVASQGASRTSPDEPGPGGGPALTRCLLAAWQLVLAVPSPARHMSVQV